MKVPVCGPVKNIYVSAFTVIAHYLRNTVPYL